MLKPPAPSRSLTAARKARRHYHATQNPEASCDIHIQKCALSSFVLRHSAACTKTAALLVESRTACIAHFANSRSHLWNCCSIYKSFGLRQQISFLIDFNQHVSQPAHQTCTSFDAGDIGAIYRPQPNAHRRRIHRVFTPLLHQRSRSEALSHFIYAARPRNLSGPASRQKRPYGSEPSALSGHDQTSASNVLSYALSTDGCT